MRCTTTIVATIGLVFVAGCGKQQFIPSFPAGTSLQCEEDASILRAMVFTFDSNQNKDSAYRAKTGQIKVTFGDAEESFEIGGTFDVTTTVDAPAPKGTIAIALDVPDELKQRYRDLAQRILAKATPTAAVSIPKELPANWVIDSELDTTRRFLTATKCGPFGTLKFKTSPTATTARPPGSGSK